MTDGIHNLRSKSAATALWLKHSAKCYSLALKIETVVIRAYRAARGHSRRPVRYGSLADMALDVLDVRFTPRKRTSPCGYQRGPGPPGAARRLGAKPRRSAKADIGFAARTARG